MAIENNPIVERFKTGKISRHYQTLKKPVLKLSENAVKVLEKRYLKKDMKGNPIETPEGMFRRFCESGQCV